LQNDSTLREFLVSQRVNTSYAIAVLDLRTSLNLTQQQFAELLNTSLSVVSRIENGNSHPTWKMLSNIAEATEIKISFED